MRSLMRIAAALLLCLALVQLQQLTPCGSALQRAFVQAAPSHGSGLDASAFDDDDDAPIAHFDEDDAVIFEHEHELHDATPSTPAATVHATAPPTHSASSLEEADAAELLVDDDEFVGAPVDEEPVARAKQPAGSSKKKGKKAAAAASAAAASAAASAASASEPSVGNVLRAPTSFFQPLGLAEYIGAGLVVLYILNYLRGCRSNRAIASSWARACVPLFGEQFALVGENEAAMTAGLSDPLAQLIKESEHCYRLPLSGRRHLAPDSVALVSLDLAPRQDLLSILLGVVDLVSMRDTVSIEVPLDDASMGPFIFALLRKRLARKIQRASPDLEPLAPSKSVNPKLGLEAGFVVLSELGAELESELLTERVAKLLTQPEVEKLFMGAHWSDQSGVSFSSSKKILRFQFALPSSFRAGSGSAAVETPLDALLALTRLALALIDRTSEIVLSPAARAKSEAKRKKIAEAEAKATVRERQEAMARRKEEMRRKEAELLAREPHSDAAKELLRKKEAREAKLAKKARGQNVKVMR